MEHEARRAEALGVRVIRLRFGVVLGRGAAPTRRGPGRAPGLAAVLGSPPARALIHLDDAVGRPLRADRSQLEGAVNAAPQAVDQAGTGLATSFGRRVRLRLPGARCAAWPGK
ncbi:MAG: hypothetical protein U1E77_15430 [Inhella sp.]